MTTCLCVCVSCVVFLPQVQSSTVAMSCRQWREWGTGGVEEGWATGWPCRTPREKKYVSYIVMIQ